MYPSLPALPRWISSFSASGAVNIYKTASNSQQPIRRSILQIPKPTFQVGKWEVSNCKLGTGPGSLLSEAIVAVSNHYVGRHVDMSGYVLCMYAHILGTNKVEVGAIPHDTLTLFPRPRGCVYVYFSCCWWWWWYLLPENKCGVLWDKYRNDFLCFWTKLLLMPTVFVIICPWSHMFRSHIPYVFFEFQYYIESMYSYMV